MESVLLIAPDFGVILLGIVLARMTSYPKDFWHHAEHLIFYVLFPCLLFTSVANSKIEIGTSAVFLATAVGAMLLAVVTSGLLRFLTKVDSVTFASVFQLGFRFNTYIGFALVSRLFGEEGFALMALLIAVWVPISNSIAVGVLASAVARRDIEAGSQGAAPTSVRRQVVTSTVKAIVKNPLIIATALGLVVNVTQCPVPAVGMQFLAHLGKASLAMGLLCIGAGMRFSGMRSTLGLLGLCTVQRLVLVPAVAVAVAYVVGIAPLAAGVCILFAALPTAQSCYVMTTSMGGNGPVVANATTLQTLASMATLPLWVALVLEPLARSLP